jgi:D-glycero-D-manno-heptose 1,7-bisphosphate phosphatase
MKSLRPAVFLDRDGVLNRSLVIEGKPYAPRHLKDFRLLPGAAAAVARLRAAGFVIVVVTNQPDIGNSLVNPADVAAMNARLRQRVAIDDLRMCPHRREDLCACRKPKPGMLLAAAEELGLDLPRSYMVGDRGGDIVAGQAAKCYTILVQRHYKEPWGAEPDAQVTCLAQAAGFILEREFGRYVDN